MGLRNNRVTTLDDLLGRGPAQAIEMPAIGIEVDSSPAPQSRPIGEVASPNLADSVTQVSDIARRSGKGVNDSQIDNMPNDRLTYTAAGEDAEILNKQYRKEKLALEGARAGIQIFNAMSQYNRISAGARSNILQLENQIGDAKSRGQGRALSAQLDGEEAADQAVMSLVAQGQSATGAGTQRVKSSYEAVGLYNAMIEEINMSREIYGFELEQIQQELATDQAEIQRNVSVISSAVQFGASAYSLS